MYPVLSLSLHQRVNSKSKYYSTKSNYFILSDIKAQQEGKRHVMMVMKQWRAWLVYLVSVIHHTLNACPTGAGIDTSASKKRGGLVRKSGER